MKEGVGGGGGQYSYKTQAESGLKLLKALMSLNTG